MNVSLCPGLSSSAHIPVGNCLSKHKVSLGFWPSQKGYLLRRANSSVHDYKTNPHFQEESSPGRGQRQQDHPLCFQCSTKAILRHCQVASRRQPELTTLPQKIWSFSGWVSGLCLTRVSFLFLLSTFNGNSKMGRNIT